MESQIFNSVLQLLHAQKIGYPLLILHEEVDYFFNPFAPGDFAEKRDLKLVEWFSGHCRAIKS